MRFLVRCCGIGAVYNSRALYCCLFFQAEDGIRDLVRSRGLGDVYKRQHPAHACGARVLRAKASPKIESISPVVPDVTSWRSCLLYTSDAADERSSVDLGGRRIIKKNTYRSRS